MNQKQFSLKIFLVFLGGIVLCFYAFYNNYPLLYPDTGAYMFSGFLDGIPHDRPKTYGLFLRHLSLSDITWLVVFTQGILVSFLVYFMIKYFIPKAKYLFWHFLLISFLTVFTGVSVTVSMLIPDIFTSIFIMAFALVLIAPINNRRDLYFISFLFWLGIIMHNSHLLIALGMIFILSIFHFLKKRKIFSPNQLIRCWAIIGISFLTIPSIHYITDKEFVLSKGSHVFIMYHLIETGIVDDFLKKQCPKKEYTLCQFQGQIPTNFIWDYENSPLHIVWKGKNVWEESREEYNQIIKEILSTPKYVLMLSYKSIIYTFKQFFSFDTGDTDPHLENSTTYGAINWFYNDESREELLALQQRRNKYLDYKEVNFYQKVLFFLSLCFYIIVLSTSSLREKLSNNKKLLLLFIFFALIVNAFVCSNLSTVVPRYQSRVVWLLPVIVFICLSEIIPKSRLKK
jgi:hypothetical protein